MCFKNTFIRSTAVCNVHLNDFFVESERIEDEKREKDVDCTKG
jgi:hypothetical protein